MPSHSKNKKKKSKSKSVSKKHYQSGTQTQLSAELVNDEEQYPTSRIIKRAPNGDIIVEALENNGERKKKQDFVDQTSMSLALDSHWEWLSSEEKKNILRIDKNEVFEMLSQYSHHVNNNTNSALSNNGNNSNNHGSCNCSVCGRRHMAMDQELEKIYDTLYEIQKEQFEDMNPIKFHLGIIRELQKSKNTDFETSPLAPPDVANQRADFISLGEELEKLRVSKGVDELAIEDIQKFLSDKNGVTLQKEVMNYKQSKAKQLQHEQQQNSNEDSQKIRFSQDIPDIHDDPEELENIEQVKHLQENDITPSDESVEKYKECRMKYMKFVKTFISSHPTIAKEYVNKMMLFPEMRQLTDDLMNNSGNGFIKAIENFVTEKQTEPSIEIPEESLDSASYQSVGDAKEFTTMLHNGKPLTIEEYANLQRHIAERVINSYDPDKKEFSGISQLEKELFTRFLHGNENKQFGDLILQSFKDKYDDDLSSDSIGTSLAAAANTSSDLNGLFNDTSRNDEDTEEDNDYYDEVDADGSDDYDHLYDDNDDSDKESYEISAYDDDKQHSSDLVEAHSCSSKHHSIDCIHPEHHHHHHNHDHLECDSQIDNHDVPETLHNHESDGYSSSHQDHQYSNEIDDEEYESGIDETERLEEGKKLLQISITKILQSRIMKSYHEKQAEINRMKLLKELEAEESKKREKEEKKQKKREKEKEKKKMQQTAKEEEKRKKDEEAEKQKKEAEKRELERREAQRKKVEEAKRKKDEERRRKLEEQRRREEEQEKQRKAKEELKRKKEEERKKREEKEAELKRKKEEEKLQKELVEKQALVVTTEKPKQTFSEQVTAANASSLLGTSHNAAYNSMLSPTPSLQQQPSDVNDRILNMVNAASASQSTSTSPSYLALLQRDEEQNLKTHPSSNLYSSISNSATPFINHESLLHTDVSNKSNSFLTLSSLNNPQLINENDFNNNIAASQPTNLQNWNGFTSSASADQQTFMSQNTNTTSRVGLHSVGSEPTRQPFTDELSNITNLLSSTALDESAPPSHNMLWASHGTPLSMNTSLSTNMPTQTNLASSTGAIPSQNISIGNTSQRSSIWDTPSTSQNYSSLNKNASSSFFSDIPFFVNSAGDTTGYTSNSHTNTAAGAAVTRANSNLWSSSNVPGLSYGENSVSDSTSAASNSAIIMAELANLVKENSGNTYITNEVLLQKVLNHGLNQSTYYKELTDLRNSGQLKFYLNENGSVSHIQPLLTYAQTETLTPQNHLNNSTGNMASTLLSQPIYNQNQPATAQSPIPSLNNLANQASHTNLFNVNAQPINNPSLMGNIWG